MGQGMECGMTGFYLGDEGSKPICLEGVEEKMGNTENVDVEPRTAVDTVVKCNGWSHSRIGI